MLGAENIQLDEQSQEELKSLAASRTSAVRLWERATIIMELAAGRAKQELAKQLGLARQTVRRWEQRFLQRGIAGLNDALEVARRLEQKRAQQVGSAKHDRRLQARRVVVGALAVVE